jgi:hypothetical protein
MKKIYLSLIALVCTILQTGCTCDAVPTEPTTTGNGTFALSVNADDIQTEVTTRGTVDVSPFKVNLKDKNGVSLIEGKAYGQLSDADRTLPASTGYQISVESCTQAEATTANEGWGAMRFTGSASFDIISDQSIPVEINCSMENAGLKVAFDNSFTTKFPIYAATTVDNRSLVFKGSNPNAIAFFDVEGENPSISLKLTGSAGGWEDRIDQIKTVGLTKGKITTLTVVYDDNSGRIDIEFEPNTDTETDDSNDVTVQ